MPAFPHAPIPHTPGTDACAEQLQYHVAIQEEGPTPSSWGFKMLAEAREPFGEGFSTQRQWAQQSGLVLLILSRSMGPTHLIRLKRAFSASTQPPRHRIGTSHQHIVGRAAQRTGGSCNTTKGI